MHFEIPPIPLLEQNGLSSIRTCCNQAEPVIVFKNEDSIEFEEISSSLIVIEGTD